MPTRNKHAHEALLTNKHAHEVSLSIGLNSVSLSAFSLSVSQTTHNQVAQTIAQGSYVAHSEPLWSTQKAPSIWPMEKLCNPLEARGAKEAT